MRSISDQDLVMHYYRETGDDDAIDAALDDSPELAARYREIRSVLDAAAQVEPVEPPAGYEARLWRELEPHLGERRRSLFTLRPNRRWALAAAALILVIAAFLAGRVSAPPTERARVVSPSHRILVASVVDHLQRTELLLLELVNSEDAAIDLGVERSLARELSKANRLYRQAARRQGDRRTAALLDELELTLLQIAHVERGELAEIRQRLEDGDLLFKVQVVRVRLRTTAEDRSPTHV